MKSTATASRSQRSKKAARAAREPWILASNLPAGRKLAHRVVQIYHQRMQIEESFRDMKSARFGLALEFHRSRDPQRLAILLLILAFALLVLWLIGSIAKERGPLSGQYRAAPGRSIRDLSRHSHHRTGAGSLYTRRIMHRLAKHPTP